MSAWHVLGIVFVAGPCLLAASGGASGAPSAVSDVWRLDLGASPWRDRADQIPLVQRPHHTVVVDGPGADAPDATPPYEVVPMDGGGLDFRIVGRGGKPRAMFWTRAIGPIDCTAVQYCVLRYRAEGIQRQPGETPRRVVDLIQTDASGKTLGTVHLLDSHQVMNDGLSHALIGRLENAGEINGVEVLISTMDSSARVVIEAIELHASPPADAQGFGEAMAADEATRQGFVPLDISGQFNDTLAAAFDRSIQHSKVLHDATRHFQSPGLKVSRVPFRVQPDGNNIIRLPDIDPSAGLTDEYLGETVTRKLFRPLSRDQIVTVAVGQKAREVLFLLAGEFPSITRPYGMPAYPTRVDDVEVFLVELVYAEGESEFAFPYSIADEGHVLSRALGVYAVPADPERLLDRVVFHSRVNRFNFSPAAVTVNVSSQNVVSAFADAPRPQEPQLRPLEPLEPRIGNQAGRLVCSNSHYEITLNCRQGFSIERIVNRAAPDAGIALHPSSGLEVEFKGDEITMMVPDALSGAEKEEIVAIGDRILTGRAFRTTGIAVADAEATISLASEQEAHPMALRVTVSVDDSAELGLRLHVENRADIALEATFRFPNLNQLTIGSAEDTWIFYPKYRTVLTNKRRSLRAIHGNSYPAPFFDTFSPSAGAGVMVLTRNLDMVPVFFAMNKTDQGVNCGAEYIDFYHAIPAKGSLDTVPSRLIPHAGDWHEATAIYRSWKDTWFTPRRAKNSEWFQRAFLMRSHIPTETTARNYLFARPFYDKTSGVYHIDEVLEADRKYWGGLLPDLFHFYGWHYNDATKSYAWGDYALPEVYDRIGGLEKFRGAVDTLQKKHGMHVSLYSLVDRASESTQAYEKFKEAGAVRNSDGSAREEGDFRFLCSGYEPWLDDYIGQLVKVQSDTDASVLYLDVFPRGNTCFDKTHGHEVPLRPEQLNHRMTQRVRNELPDTVAFYSEYPYSDVDSQYADGFLAYYHLDVEGIFGSSYHNDERASLFAESPFALNRFLFPGVKQFGFPCGIRYDDASKQNASFLNGDGFFSSNWWSRSERMQGRMTNALRVQRKYADCFVTRTPQPRISTLKVGIVANAFPAEHQTAWTLYNTRYQTWRGPSLSVEHKEGATYRDAWNDRGLEPQVRDGRAILSVPLDPQGLGCIVQQRRNVTP